MRIALLSDSPNLPSGFARTTRLFAHTLVARGHTVACYGIGVSGESFVRANYPYTVWGAGAPQDDHSTRFAEFVRLFRPEALLLNYDLLSTLTWLRLARNCAPQLPVVGHVLVDALPVDTKFLKPLDNCKAVVVPTNCAARAVARVLRTPVHVLPHLVDGGSFAPSNNSPRTPREPYLVGTFGTNRARKQLQQVMQAIALLNKDGLHVHLLVRTDSINKATDGGDDLARIAAQLGLEDEVSFEETRDITDAIGQDPHADLALAARIRSVDVVVVASTCGGFEYGIVEAQACGVPVCSTDDLAAMSETAGGATFLLEPSLFDIVSYGGHWNRLSPATIAKGIRATLTDRLLRANLVRAGLENAALYDREANVPRLNQVFDHLFPM